ncbi:MAG: YeeE/YedE family protein [Gammaproteobacteria bacterium]|nr:YeeE/YedE family protein [Gammaproteobacteria bacterium]
MELQITTQILIWAFALAFVLGAVANKTNFCTMGAVSDWVNMGDTNRMKAWLLAIAVALLGVTLIEGIMGYASIDPSLPPYRSEQFAWLRYIVGGVLFGIGMTFASGCGNKTLVRIGGGNIKSIFVLIVAGFFAYLMTKTDFYAVLFHPWVSATTINLGKMGMAGQDIPAIIGGIFGAENLNTLRIVFGLIIGSAILFHVFRSEDFRSNNENVISGIIIGIIIVLAWAITGGSMGTAWKEAVDFMDEVPVGVMTQSYTFINPMGDTFALALDPTNSLLISFGVMSLFGVIAGSLVISLLAKAFRIEWFNDLKDFINHMFGAVLMGIGGVLGMGCTIGQGITGFSTLALGSILVFVSIVFGSALTMKIQFYKMVYEEEATFAKSFITALVDMKLLPAAMRKLEAV